MQKYVVSTEANVSSDKALRIRFEGVRLFRRLSFDDFIAGIPG